MNTNIASTLIVFGVTLIIYAVVGELLRIGECQRTTKRLLKLALLLIVIGAGMLSHTFAVIAYSFVGCWIGWRSASILARWIQKRISLPVGRDVFKL
jgi:hypothetical protein